MTDTTDVADVAVIGLGYIGLPTAAVLARAGLDVVGVDRIRERVEAVNRGELPFLEEGLATVLAEQVEAGRLRAQMETPSARTYIIAVPTPSTGSDHAADRPSSHRGRAHRPGVDLPARHHSRPG